MTYLPRFPNAKDALKYLPAETAPLSTSRSPLTRRISSIGTWIGDWIDTMSDYYAAAAMYGQLSRLSDAELRRRGLSRASLARDICAACDRAERQD